MDCLCISRSRFKLRTDLSAAGRTTRTLKLDRKCMHTLLLPEPEPRATPSPTLLASEGIHQATWYCKVGTSYKHHECHHRHHDCRISRNTNPKVHTIIDLIRLAVDYRQTGRLQQHGEHEPKERQARLLRELPSQQASLRPHSACLRPM